MHASKMKVYAVPLARLGPKGTEPLVYFHSYLPPPPKTSHKDTSGGPHKHPLRLQLEQRLKLLPNAPLHLQLTTKFSSLWQELGHNEPKTWKFKAHRFGEKMMDKIEFEEWSLKTVEKGLVPPGLVGVASKESPEEDQEQRKEKVEEAKTLQKDGVKQDKEFVQLFYPLKADFDPLRTFETFLVERGPYHDRLMKRSMWALPVASLFGILPVIPNFPFMYVAWRTWSHYKARNAAQLLSALIAAGRIRPVESSTLDSVLPPSSSEGGGRMLINRKGVERMVEKEGLPEASLEELMRAFKQAEERLAALPPASSSNGPPSPSS